MLSNFLKVKQLLADKPKIWTRTYASSAHTASSKEN